METSSLTSGIVSAVLSEEDDALRFEQLCVELFSELDGVDYITTSASWDMTKDGRQISLINKNLFPVLCVSLNEKINKKTESDITKLLQADSTSIIRYCTNQKISDHSIQKLKSDLSVLVNARAIQPDIIVEGLEQITNLKKKNSKYEMILEKFYPAEIAEQRSALANRNISDDSELSGMRIALSTQLSVDGSSVRNELLHNLVLSALLDGQKRTRAGITKLISESLALGRIVHDSYISSALTELEENRSLLREGKLFSLTFKGRQYLEQKSLLHDQTLSQGKQLLFDAILSSSGHNLTTTDYELVWKTVQESLASILYINGVQIINALSTLVFRQV